MTLLSHLSEFNCIISEFSEFVYCTKSITYHILVRSVISDSSVADDYGDNELINLYRPVVDSDAENGINIYITEDTELERGITDAIVNNFDNIIMKVLFDYLYWILREDDTTVSDKWFMSFNGDYINAETIDKLKFLKYGGEKLNDVLDLELVLECLWNLILDGNDTLTYSRAQVLERRCAQNPFKDFEEAVENKTETEPENEPDKEQSKKKTKKSKKNKKNSDSKQSAEETKQNASADVAGASVEATESGENKKTQKSEQTEAEASEPEQTSVNKKKGLFQNIKDKFRTKNSQQNNASTDVKKAEAVAKDKKEKQ